MIASGVLMFTGVAALGIFIAFATRALTRAQFTAIQGLRQIRTRGHVVVLGCGNVGTRVVEFLRVLGRRVVVVELKPDSALVEMSAGTTSSWSPATPRVTRRSTSATSRTPAPSSP